MDGSRWTRGAMDMAVLYDTYLGIDLAGTGRYLEELIFREGYTKYTASVLSPADLPLDERTDTAHRRALVRFGKTLFYAYGGIAGA